MVGVREGELRTEVGGKRAAEQSRKLEALSPQAIDCGEFKG
jgi:hypothetical protein